MKDEIYRKVDECLWKKDVKGLLELIKEDDTCILYEHSSTCYGDFDLYKGTNPIGFLAAHNHFDLVKNLIVKHSIVLAPDVYSSAIEEQNMAAIEFFMSLGVNIDACYVKSEVFGKYMKLKQMSKMS